MFIIINPLYSSQKFQVIFTILLLPFICAFTPDSKALTDTRTNRYIVIWRSEIMGDLINQREEYEKDLSEFLLLADKFTIKSLVSTSGIIETQTYKIE